jgi:hypothetical protein
LVQVEFKGQQKRRPVIRAFFFNRSNWGTVTVVRKRLSKPPSSSELACSSVMRVNLINFKNAFHHFRRTQFDILLIADALKAI